MTETIWDPDDQPLEFYQYLSKRDRMLRPYILLTHDMKREWMSVGDLAGLLSDENMKVTKTMVLNWLAKVKWRDYKRESGSWNRFSIVDSIIFFVIRELKQMGVPLKESFKVYYPMEIELQEHDYLSHYFQSKPLLFIYTRNSWEILMPGADDEDLRSRINETLQHTHTWAFSFHQYLTRVFTSKLVTKTLPRFRFDPEEKKYYYRAYEKWLPFEDITHVE